MDVVRSGALGTDHLGQQLLHDERRLRKGWERRPTKPPPPGLDWDGWLGPAPKRRSISGRFRDGMHRYFKDYVDSWLHELGPHIVELPFWALELPCPTAIAASGGRYATDSLADVPDTLHVTWEWPRHADDVEYDAGKAVFTSVWASRGRGANWASSFTARRARCLPTTACARCWTRTASWSRARHIRKPFPVRPATSASSLTA